MPAVIPVEDQLKFLISCIRFSNNGKIDFAQVAIDCDIVSKGAASKRYERLMKTHGITNGFQAVKPTARCSPNKTDARTPSTAPLSKKRNFDQVENTLEGDSDEEDPVFLKKIKPELSRVKKEEKGQLGMGDKAANLEQYSDKSSYGSPAPASGVHYKTKVKSEYGGMYSSTIPRASVAPSVATSYHTAYQYPDGDGGEDSPVVLE